MSGIQITLVVVLVLWQVLVALSLIVLFRQVALLSVRLGEIDARDDDSGATLYAGAEIPAMLADLVSERDVSYVFWLSATCATCHSLATDLARAFHEDVWQERTVFVLTGDGSGANAIASIVGSLGSVVREPNSSKIVQFLRLERSPFVLEVQKGVLTGWSALSEFADVLTLRDARVYSNAEEYAVARQQDAQQDRTGV